MQTALDVIPIGDRILVLRDRPVAVTEGGIVLADGAQEQPVEGTVIGLGTSYECDPKQCVVQLGDRVIFSPYTGERLAVGAKEDVYLIMRPDELLCKRRVDQPVASPEVAAAA